MYMSARYMLNKYSIYNIKHSHEAIYVTESKCQLYDFIGCNHVLRNFPDILNNKVLSYLKYCGTLS